MPKLVEIADRTLGEYVVADRGDHHDRSAELGGGDRLIGALAAVAHLEARRLDRLALYRHAVHVGDEIDHVAADDGDARLLVAVMTGILRWPGGGRGVSGFDVFDDCSELRLRRRP